MALTPQSENRRDEILLGIGFWGICGAALIFGSVYTYPSWVFISSLPFAYLLAIIWHELAHATTAAAVGYKVTHIDLASKHYPKGPSFKFRCLGFDWKIYSPFLLTGMVFYHPCQPSYYRLRCALTSAAAPLASLSMALVGAALLVTDWFPNFDLPLTTWTYSNALIFLGTIRPITTMKGDRIYRSDGANLIRLWGMTANEAKEEALHSTFANQWPSAHQTMIPMALADAQAHAAAHPDHPWLLASLLEKMKDDPAEQRVSTLLKLINHPSCSRKYSEAFIDGFLTGQLSKGPPADASCWNELSLKLLSLNNCLSTQGTRGAVLIDLGRIPEGRIILDEILIKTTSDVDKAYCHVFIALAEKHSGHESLARDHAEKAISIDDKCPALRRVVDLLPSVTA